MWGSWWNYSKNWAFFDRDEMAVYELADENKNTVYYGSGKLKTRLLDHLNKKECPLARYYRYAYFLNEKECRLQEEALLTAYKIKHKKLPIYNERIG